jgi:DNA-binding response OmpR family regulator
MERTRLHVLLVEDDAKLARLTRDYLEQHELTVTTVADGNSAIREGLRSDIDVVVLDLMLPGRDGFDVCRQLRSKSHVPIIAVTARVEVADRVLGLELGADDYVSKPFSPRELALRVGSVLRRAKGTPVAAAQETIEDGELSVDVAARVARLHGAVLALTVREFDLLTFLVRHPGRAFSRAELLERVWGWTFGDQSTVTVHVRRLREKVEDDPAQPRRIATVWGIGYRYETGS